MKKATWLLIGLLTFPMMICAQSHHTDLKWGASADAGVTYNVYKAIGACPATGLPTGATQIANLLTLLTFSDTNVQVGQTACYYVTAQLNGTESGPSNTKQAVTPVGAPGALTITTVAEVRAPEKGLSIRAY